MLLMTCVTCVINSTNGISVASVVDTDNVAGMIMRRGPPLRGGTARPDRLATARRERTIQPNPLDGVAIVVSMISGKGRWHGDSRNRRTGVGRPGKGRLGVDELRHMSHGARERCKQLAHDDLEQVQGPA
ncbi:hypothetical protein B0O95_104214 [Mycetohabitans endofungorum]|uniref:Uncharacterized protein n=1 Tax=Mycetohabitans endofungorum TaxID=417203 RepID=A0A2P5KC47_9BURK|nr:hypothetical protein B0O95_104214 [Mycetohabitans endofungorum]